MPPNSTKMLTGFGANFGPNTRPNLVRSRPTLARNRPHLARSRPKPARFRTTWATRSGETMSILERFLSKRWCRQVGRLVACRHHASSRECCRMVSPWSTGPRPDEDERGDSRRRVATREGKACSILEVSSFARRRQAEGGARGNDVGGAPAKGTKRPSNIVRVVDCVPNPLRGRRRRCHGWRRLLRYSPSSPSLRVAPAAARSPRHARRDRLSGLDGLRKRGMP